MTELQTIIRLLESLNAVVSRVAEAATEHLPISITLGRSYTRRQAASALGVSVWSIDKARRQDLLKEAQRLGQRDVRLTGESILAFQCERQKHPPATEVMRI